MDEATPLPSWESVPGVVAVGEPEVRELDARYLDTADLSLARSGFALRRRSGGPDEGWHIKGPLQGSGRLEQHWPLDPDGDPDAPAVPPAILTELARVTTDPLLPLARIRNRRTAYALLSADGGLVAEFVDDRVTAVDQRAGAERAWREWEFELGPAAPDDHSSLFAAADEAVHAVGGRQAASASKLARALGG